MRIFLYILSFLFFLICLLSIHIKQEVGVNPSKEDVVKYSTKPYYKNGRFYNIATSIDGYKNPNKQEWQDQKMSFFTLISMLISNKRFLDKNGTQIQMKKIEKTGFSQIPDNFSFYWLGHSSMILELANKRILIDPVLNNASPVLFTVRRMVKSPIDIKDFPHFDYVLITHNHYDHLERRTIKHFRKKNTKFIVPLGLKATLIYWGIKPENIIELGWGEKYKTDNIIFNAETAIHFSGRFLFDSNNTLWNSYVLQTTSKNKKQIYIAGDGGFGTHHYDIAKKYGSFDLITAECDAWNVNWAYVHLFTREVIEIAKIMKPKYLLPVHYGVFPLGSHKQTTSINMIKNEATKAKILDKIIIPKIGEKVVIS